MKIIKFVRCVTSAAKAGWLANRCDHCVVDDDEEAIYACPEHEARIAQLAAINEANQF